METKKKINFVTAFDEQERFLNASGSPIQKVYKAIDDENGHSILVEVGETNIQDNINSHEEGSLLKNILKRYAETGDISIIQQMNSNYIDTVDMPNNLGDMLNAKNKAEAIYASLDPKIKETLSYDDFINNLINGYSAKSAEKVEKVDNNQVKTDLEGDKNE